MTPLIESVIETYNSQKPLNEGISAPLHDLNAKGAVANWDNSIVKYAKSKLTGLKSTANANIAKMEGTLAMDVGGGGQDFNKLIAVLEYLRQEYGAPYNAPYRNQSDLNFSFKVPINAAVWKYYVDGMKFRHPELDPKAHLNYHGIEVFSSVKHLSDNKFDISFGIKMIK
ncbi:hypothetical protein [Delftia phage PhiW-14]|uniref:Uncharacterized protein n=1 Tax=Delftia phage PhiW-14 TaxID=665032 RepID=C9DFY9_BPW14|nr:hypothetical protein DP-phiW-14_gp017 [Delftia phage PhiW-14]ACV50040.1 hypothetical protein [Delftia phage PhiW-14]